MLKPFLQLSNVIVIGEKLQFRDEDMARLRCSESGDVAAFLQTLCLERSKLTIGHLKDSLLSLNFCPSTLDVFKRYKNSALLNNIDLIDIK